MFTVYLQSYQSLGYIMFISYLQFCQGFDYIMFTVYLQFCQSFGYIILTVYLQFCQSFGYICELCGEESDIIYPFQLQTVAVCKGLLVYLLNEINFTHAINKCFNSIKLFSHVTIDIASHLETHGHSRSEIMSLLPKFVSFS